MQEEKVIRAKYHVISVDKTTTPEGLPGKNWYRYVIGYGNKTIDGSKPGTLQNVTQHAEDVAQALNDRSTSSRSTYAPRQNHQKKISTKSQ